MQFDPSKAYKTQHSAAGTRLVQNGRAYYPSGQPILEDGVIEAPEPEPEQTETPEFPPLSEEELPFGAITEKVLMKMHWGQVKVVCRERGLEWTNMKESIARILESEKLP